MEEFKKINEECGIFGVYSQKNYDIASDVYYGLFALQHRGQESCGIVVNDDGLFNAYKDSGLVNDVFNQEILTKLGDGNIAIGHVRYSTTGSSGRENAQPMVVNHVKGRMALAHNGNIINALELRTQLELDGAIFHTTSDTEVISYIITDERLKLSSIEDAVCSAVSNKYVAYASENVYLNDSNSFIEKIQGDGKYVATIKYEDDFYSLKEYPDMGIIYVDDRYDPYFPKKIALTTDDHQINYVMLRNNDLFINAMKDLFSKGCFRFKNLKCKNAILKAFSF